MQEPRRLRKYTAHAPPAGMQYPCCDGCTSVHRRCQNMHRQPSNIVRVVRPALSGCRALIAAKHFRERHPLRICNSGLAVKHSVHQSISLSSEGRGNSRCQLWARRIKGFEAMALQPAAALPPCPCCTSRLAPGPAQKPSQRDCSMSSSGPFAQHRQLPQRRRVAANGLFGAFR